MLIERDGELATLELALRRSGALHRRRRLRRGRGLPGIGKTALLDAATARAEAMGMAVLRARGGELERDFPHGVVRSCWNGRGGP